MTDKGLQKERMRSYFIQATTEIILSEGLKDVSVRNIARKAGYSYATLYNYFKNAEELVFESVNVFTGECTEFVKNQTGSTAAGKERLEKTCMAYTNYFVQYPGIFELFFVEKTTQKTLDRVNGLLEELCRDDLDILEKNGELTERKSFVQVLNCSITGLLLFYLRRYFPADYQVFLANREELLKSIIKNLI